MNGEDAGRRIGVQASIITSAYHVRFRLGREGDHYDCSSLAKTTDRRSKWNDPVICLRHTRS